MDRLKTLRLLAKLRKETVCRVVLVNVARMDDCGNLTKIILTVGENYNIYLNTRQHFEAVKDSILKWHVLNEECVVHFCHYQMFVHCG